MKWLRERIVDILKGIAGIILLLIGMLVYGAIHQAMAFAECAPGKAELSFNAFLAAGLGGTICRKDT